MRQPVSNKQRFASSCVSFRKERQCTERSFSTIAGFEGKDRVFEPSQAPGKAKKESLANPVSIDLRGQSGCKGYATMRLHNVGEHSCK